MSTTPSGPRPLFGITGPSPRAREAFQMVIIPSNGTALLGYRATGNQFIELVAVSADVDTNGASGDVPIQLELSDQSGTVYATNRAGVSLRGFNLTEITFAARLPDTGTLPSPTSSVFVQTGMPEAIMTPGDQVFVRALDAGAIITELRLWIWDADLRMTDMTLIRPVRVRAV